MLHITLDTSIVEINLENATFSCSITGVEEVETDYNNVKKNTSETEFKEWYFPWEWKLENAKLLWIGKDVLANGDAESTFTEVDSFSVLSTIDLINHNASNLINHDTPEDKLKVFYEKRLDQIIDKNDDNTVYKLKESYCNSGEKQIFKMSDLDEKGTYEEIGDQLKSQFLGTSIAYYAQQLPPLNQSLKLSLFFEADNNFFIPENATHFLIYIPIGGYEVKSVDLSRIVDQNKLLPANDNEFLDIPIELRNGPLSVILHQPVTAIDSYKTDDFIGKLIDFPREDYKSKDVAGKTIITRTPLKIRESKFHFNGNTKLNVSDVSEISYRTALLRRKYTFGELLITLFKSIQIQDYLKENASQKLANLTQKFINQLFSNQLFQKTEIESHNFFNKAEIEIFRSSFSCALSDTFSFQDENLKYWTEINHKLTTFSKEEIDEKIMDKWLIVLNDIKNIILSDRNKVLYYQINLNNGTIDEEQLKKIDRFIAERQIIVYGSFEQSFLNVISAIKKDEVINLFIKTFANSLDVGDISIDITHNIKELFSGVESHFNASENIPPPLNIEVQEINTQTGTDLINEISGHILLSRRSKSKARPDKLDKTKYKKAFGYWKYLNWAKVSLDNGNSFLNGKYLIPAALPKINGTQKTSFHLNNESLSIIAGHDNQTGDDASDAIMNFNYSFVDENGNNGVPAAPALWYGHYYEFVGFVALNSGALPSAIRKYEKGVTLWNIPEVDDIVFDNDIEIASYHHMRCVPIGLPNISTDYINHYPQVPLLINELVKNSSESIYDEKGNKVEQKKITAFLLCEKTGNKDKQEKEINQSQVTITVDKPYTNFWNWYAWMGAKTVNVDDKSDVFKNALKAESDLRSQTDGKTKEKNPYLWERAISDDLVVKVEQIFPIPVKKNIDDIILNIINNEGESKTDNFKVTVGEIIGFKDKTLTIPPGTICKISIYCKVAKAHFEGTQPMFHSWMKNHISVGEYEKDYFLTNPEVIYIETAIKNEEIIKGDDARKTFGESLYKALQPNYTSINEYGVYCTLKNEVDGILKEKYPYFSKCEVKHQVWNWNGRLFADLNYQQTFNADKTLIDTLNPQNDETTEAMKWEAWEFASRPDFTALISNENITASFVNEKNENLAPLNQMVFKDVHPLNDAKKAHYFRFGLNLYNRYESIGKGYNEPFQATKGENEDKWKRLLKPIQKLAKLPKPAIRFVIPLTDALEVTENNENKVRAASMMIATYARCFDEAGLAEQFQFGIEIANDGDKNYLQAGEDPILSGDALPPIKGVPFDTSSDKRVFAVFSPVGPAGLTFDTNAQHPKVLGSTFILNVEDIQKMLPAGKKINAYAMVKVAIRRVLKADFVSEILLPDGVIKEIKECHSDWSASEWVQFLPAVDSLIPTAWKDAVRNSDGIVLKQKDGFIEIAGNMPSFDKSFEDMMDRYLIISENIDDIGGQPVEKYVGVCKWDGEKDDKSIKFIDNQIISTIDLEKGGYARIMLVRKQKDTTSDQDIWSQLFGGKKDEQGKRTTYGVQFGEIVNDPLAAMPLVSKRIAILNK